MDAKGKVYVAGAGPGKADLITVRGLEILRQADVVIYDYLVDKAVLKNARKGAELICCDRLAKKGRYSDGFLIHQEKIHGLIVKKARQGKKVMRLKNGCPSVFSRLSGELKALVKAGIEFEIVPGVTAASAASCFSGIPLTDRRLASSTVFVTGHEDPQKKASSLDWEAISRAGTIVVYMGLENLERIAQRLIAAGKGAGTPAAVIQDAGLISQKIVTGSLRDIAGKAKDKNITAPAIVIIGEVINFEKNFDWAKRNKRVLYTGLSDERFFLKGTYVHLPLIDIVPAKDYRPLDRAIRGLQTFDWIIFTSRYGVEYFFRRLKYAGLDSRSFGGIRVAAVGASTRNELLRHGVRADLVPKKESSIGLLQEFRKIELEGRRILLPRSDIADKGLAACLKEMGARVASVVAYRNIPAGNLPNLDLRVFDEIFFTSPSVVRSFRKRYPRIPRGVRVRCIGDVTEKEARRCRLLS